MDKQVQTEKEYAAWIGVPDGLGTGGYDIEPADMLFTDSIDEAKAVTERLGREWFERGIVEYAVGINDHDGPLSIIEADADGFHVTVWPLDQ